MESDQIEPAINEFKIAIQMAPREPGLHEELGNLYWKTGKLDEAQQAYEQELQLDPHSAVAMYRLGSLLCERNQPKKAVCPGTTSRTLFIPINF